jgi:acetone carboxylase gamma subunit
MYVQHKVLCKIFQKKGNGISITQSSRRKAATVPARFSSSASSRRPVSCWCGSTFKNYQAPQTCECRYTVYKQQTNAHLASSDPIQLPIQLPMLDLGSDLVSSAEKRSTSTAEVTAQKIQCSCGQNFANEKMLKTHMRYSKAHQVGNLQPATNSNATTPCTVLFTAPQSPPTSIPPASGPVPGTFPSSVLVKASLLLCTCGYSFKTQRILDLHKRDSIFHKRQWDDSIITSLASLNLGSQSTQARPPVARCKCICGRTFTNQAALEHHTRDNKRPALQDEGEGTAKISKTPRPQYQADEYLQEMAECFAQQYRVET